MANKKSSLTARVIAIVSLVALSVGTVAVAIAAILQAFQG